MTTEQLAPKPTDVQPGQLWQDKNGHIYRILQVARCSESKDDSPQWCVVYDTPPGAPQEPHSHEPWCRKLGPAQAGQDESMFLDLSHCSLLPSTKVDLNDPTHLKLLQLAKTREGMVQISSAEGYYTIRVRWEGQWTVEVGCQHRSLERWLRYGNTVARVHGTEDEELEWYTSKILEIAQVLGVPIPPNVGNQPFDYQHDDPGDPDEDDDEDDCEDWDDDDEDDWDDDEDEYDDEEGWEEND
jgi:hypothetical protein